MLKLNPLDSLVSSSATHTAFVLSGSSYSGVWTLSARRQTVFTNECVDTTTGGPWRKTLRNGCQSRHAPWRRLGCDTRHFPGMASASKVHTASGDLHVTASLPPLFTFCIQSRTSLRLQGARVNVVVVVVYHVQD